MLVDVIHLLNTLMDWLCRSDANTTSLGAERIKMANANMKTLSSIATDCGAATFGVLPTLVLASDSTVANALSNKKIKKWAISKLQIDFVMRKFLLALFAEQMDHEWGWYCINHKQLGRYLWSLSGSDIIDWWRPTVRDRNVAINDIEVS